MRVGEDTLLVGFTAGGGTNSLTHNGAQDRIMRRILFSCQESRPVAMDSEWGKTIISRKEENLPEAKILVVQDEVMLAKELATFLNNLGYEIIGRVSTGDEAVRLTEESEPDLILMDIELRGEIDGIETAGRIRSRHDVPVVYLTAYPEPVQGH